MLISIGWFFIAICWYYVDLPFATHHRIQATINYRPIVLTIILMSNILQRAAVTVMELRGARHTVNDKIEYAYWRDGDSVPYPTYITSINVTTVSWWYKWNRRSFLQFLMPQLQACHKNTDDVQFAGAQINFRNRREYTTRSIVALACGKRQGYFCALSDRWS